LRIKRPALAKYVGWRVTHADPWKAIDDRKRLLSKPGG
jgi:hypothetical protein